jgi:hypothetical protein
MTQSGYSDAPRPPSSRSLNQRTKPALFSWGCAERQQSRQPYQVAFLCGRTQWRGCDVFCTPRRNGAFGQGTEERVGASNRFYGMSNRPETCRNKAIECERIARENVTTDLALIDLYLDLARQWRQMAEQTEDLERLRVGARRAG